MIVVKKIPFSTFDIVNEKLKNSMLEQSKAELLEELPIKDNCKITYWFEKARYSDEQWYHYNRELAKTKFKKLSKKMNAEELEDKIYEYMKSKNPYNIAIHIQEE